MLQKAVWHGQMSACRTLLAQGVTLHDRDMWGWTALDYAIRGPNASYDLVQSLLDAGAHLCPTDPHVIRSINQVAAMGDVKRLRFYLQAGCSLEVSDAGGATAVIQQSVVRWLV